MRRALAIGLILWLAGTVAIRLVGERLLLPGRPLVTIALYAASFVLMALLAPRILRGSDDPRAAVTLLMLPTLVLDAFASAFFADVYPNVAAEGAGLFGGWMLIFCAGAVAGVWLRRG